MVRPCGLTAKPKRRSVVLVARDASRLHRVPDEDLAVLIRRGDVPPVRTEDQPATHELLALDCEQELPLSRFSDAGDEVPALTMPSVARRGCNVATTTVSVPRPCCGDCRSRQPRTIEAERDVQEVTEFVLQDKESSPRHGLPDSRRPVPAVATGSCPDCTR